MIKVDSIKKSFASNQVLRGVSFEIAEGSIYGLIGRNGAGKTTLMNIMSGLMKADSGSCKFGNKEKSKVGYLPDIPAFYDYLSTDEYLDFLLKDSDAGRRNELLELVGLTKGLRIKTMSRGMKQRLGIAGVLVGNPDVILMDEPTSALDPAGRNDVKKILLQLKEQGKTIILSTHILTDMDSICDRAGFLSGGVIAREVNVNDSQKGASEISVTFAARPNLEELASFVSKILIQKNGDGKNVKLILDETDPVMSQKRALQGLALMDQEIISISSAAFSLDNIFQEVCGK